VMKFRPEKPRSPDSERPNLLAYGFRKCCGSSGFLSDLPQCPKQTTVRAQILGDLIYLACAQNNLRAHGFGKQANTTVGGRFTGRLPEWHRVCRAAQPPSHSNINHHCGSSGFLSDLPQCAQKTGTPTGMCTTLDNQAKTFC